MANPDPRMGTIVETYLQLNRDTGYVHRVRVRTDPETNLQETNDRLVIGHIDEIRKNRKHLLPEIRGFRESAEDTVPTPTDYAATTGELEQKLSTMKSAGTIKAMAARDDRSSARALYTRRLEALANADEAAGEIEGGEAEE